MKAKILIVEDQFIEANNLKIILKKSGYLVCPIAGSVPEALEIIDRDQPDLVLLDIQLKGHLTGIDLASILNERNIAFVFLSANSDKQVLNAAKATQPYGFLVKPFREKDVLVMLDVAWYLHQQKREAEYRKIVQSKAPAALSGHEFKGIVGNSKPMLDLLDNVKIIGPSDTSALILGESGTGKELVAQCIHQISPRKKQPLIVVNCAALPASLIESELFGHEKGAFTGATEKRTGKFEQADQGTIFLDEVGELPLDLQVKFLRVLQEKEIEPIGGKKKKIDVRIIAATNRNLEEEIASGRFRMDLYYRLNVFPVTLPPLRGRKEDIPLLANHFVQYHARKEGKVITGLSDAVLSDMLSYNWPGNVRELENLMARSVLLATGDTITSVQLAANQQTTPPPQEYGSIKTITENERDHILAVLERCDWKIYGQGGAAEILEINSSTLSSRMKKLGIERKTSSHKDRNSG
ncbi:MAG: sigma-54 dependent transcriptional regulator [Pedobacter sp.]|uniref:sigma-54-dependent transcriptional regulator n=1 Tax=Pedobacter sp. TaxID=1411316 RepID=UPI003393E080